MTGITVTLPADWQILDPAEPVQCVRRVAAIVDAALGDDPDRATLRETLVRDLTVEAGRTAGQGTWLMAFGTLDMHTPPIPVSLLASLTAGSMFSEDLETVISSVEDARPGAGLDLGEGAFGPVLRAVGTRDDHGIPTTLVEYWTDPGHGRLAVLAFTCPTRWFAPPVLALFDAVTGTLRTDPTASGWSLGKPYPLENPT